MKNKYIKTNWESYGVIDSSELSKREDDFYEEFDKKCEAAKSKLQKLIKDNDRKLRFEKIIKNIESRKNKC